MLKLQGLLLHLQLQNQKQMEIQKFDMILVNRVLAAILES